MPAWKRDFCVRRERLVEVDDSARGDAVAQRDTNDVILFCVMESRTPGRKLIKLDAVEVTSRGAMPSATPTSYRCTLFARKSSG